MVFTVPNLTDWLRQLKKIGTDDWVDRLNYYMTTWLLLFFALMISAKQYFGSPIQCWVPAQWKGGWESYAEDYCFVSNTYNLPIEEDIPSDVVVRREKEIGYYQWVPIVLALQALMFFLPNFIWTTFNWQSGIHLEEILKKAKNLDRPDATSRELQDLATYVQDSLGTDARGRVVPSRGWLWRTECGMYMTLLYLFVKALYCINAAAQFFMMNRFLGTGHDWWGAHLVTQMLEGGVWEDSRHFPRVTMCDLTVRVLGQAHRHTIQCVIMINMFNEKIYLFLWWWIVIVGCVTMLHTLYQLLILLPQAREFTVKHNIVRSKKYTMITDEDRCDAPLLTEDGVRSADEIYCRKDMNRFARKALRADGVLTLKFIANHAGELIAAKLCQELYRRFMNGTMMPKKAYAKMPPPPRDVIKQGVNGQTMMMKMPSAPPKWAPNGYEHPQAGHNTSSTSSTSAGDEHAHHQAREGYQEQLDYVDRNAATLPRKDPIE